MQWFRDHPLDAQVLLAGATRCDLADWPDELSARRKSLRRKVRSLLAGVPADADLVPLRWSTARTAIVRRHLLTNQAIPEGADAIVADCARILIAPS